MHFESIKLLTEHTLLKLSPSTQLKGGLDGSKIVKLFPCYQTWLLFPQLMRRFFGI